MTGLYIHVPFCIKKCKYCDFVSFVGCETMADGYIDALRREAEEYKGERVDTVFIGGGTPTILTAKQIGEILNICRDNFDIHRSCEITIEANPATLDEKKMTAMLSGGVNRVSVGVQSFDDEELKKIGRVHNGEEAYKTICDLKKAGFKNINLDLMTALPSQTRSSLENTVKTALSLDITHISAYSLIIEDNTPLQREYNEGKLALPDEDEERLMYRDTVKTLSENGFGQYEISNFARAGYECRHNIKYWTGEKYIGLGAAAHSYDGERRFENTSVISDYIKGSPRSVTELTREDKMSEFMITGLRMLAGVSETDFFERFGVSMNSLWGSALDKFVSLGLLMCSDGRYALTPRGIDVSNSVLCEFV